MDPLELIKEELDKVKTENISLQAENTTIKERLDESQELSKIGNWSWNLKTNKVFWSDSMFLILGLLPSEKEPSYELALHYVHDDDKVKYEEKLKFALDNKIEYYLENKITKADKTDISVISRGRFINNNQGEVIRMIGTVQDVTQTVNLIKSNEHLNNIASILSHDISAPVKTIIGFSNLLKTKIYRNSSEKVKMYLDAIEGSAIELDDYINDVLKKAKLN